MRLAYTSKGDLWRQECGQSGFKLSVFDRNMRTWQPRGDVPTFERGQYPGLLLGAEGEYLVFGNDDYGPLRLRWVRPPDPTAARPPATSLE